MSSPGYISIAGSAVLQFPRPVDPQRGRRHVVFDTSFFVVEGTRSTSIGLLRYFSSEEMANDIENIGQKEFQNAFVVANISAVTPNSIPASLMLENQRPSDYAFVGDIHSLILIDDEENRKINPFITVAGTVTTFDANYHTFTMTPTQYIGLIHGSSPFPIHAHFVDWESKKRWGPNGPKVAVGSSITFGGSLERVVRELDIDRSLSFAEIEVVSISYLSNRGNVFARTADLASSDQTSGSRRRWSFDDPLQGSSSKIKGKRKHEDQMDDEHQLKREKMVEDESVEKKG